ncbi:MAG: azurin [Nitrincola sp.]|nr:azurin [Nitrincola sp.]
MKKAILISVLATVPVMVSATSCELVVDSTDAMRFSETELTVSSSCEKVNLTLTHSGRLPKTAMGHNWVLVESANLNAVAAEAMAAGAANEYLPVGDDRIIAATSMIGGGESTQVEFSVSELKGKDLTFFLLFSRACVFNEREIYC